MQQGRWVSYIFKYRNNARCENAGFIKVQRVASEYRVVPPRRNKIDKKTDTARIQVGMKMYKRQACRCLVYLMYRPDGAIAPKVRFLEEMHFNPGERDTITKRFELDWDSPLGDGASFDTYDGLFFVCDDGEVLAGMWDEYPFKPEEIKIDGINTATEKENQGGRSQTGKAANSVNKTIAQNVRNNQDDKTENVSNDMTVAKGDDISRDGSAGNNRVFDDAGSVDIMQSESAETVNMPSENMRDTNEAGMSQAESIDNAHVARGNMIDTDEKGVGEAGNSQDNQEDDEDMAGTSEACMDEAYIDNGNKKNSGENNQEMQENKSCIDVCREMLDTFPRLPLFADSQFVECVKIVPHDIGRLAMSNWKLGINSFLSHGYYHYRYIMMGKVKFERKEAYVIGVPGVYTNKEKYLANMFGFNIFVPAKRTKLMTGNFGYWISEILTE